MMKAVVVAEPGKIEIWEIPQPRPGPYQCLVKTELAALCNATDSKLVGGHFPGAQKFPMVLGHESIGRVVELGEKVRNFKLAQRVMGGLVFDFSDPRLASGWGGFSQYTLVQDHDAMVADGVADAAHGWFECHEIQRGVSQEIPAEEAVLMCTWREVLGAFGDFNLQAGERILICGAGPVGLSFVAMARLLKLGWIGALDRHSEKLQRARALGADAVFLPGDPDLAALRNAAPRRLDKFIDAVGSPELINDALTMIQPGGSICVYGVLSAPTLTLEKARGPFNFNLLIHQWPTRWRERQAQGPLENWIRAGELRAADFVTHRFAFTQITQAFEALKSGSAVKVLLDYPS